MPLPLKTGWDWGRSANHTRTPQPHMGFYWNMPADAPCAFSSDKGYRSFKRGEMAPHRIIALDDNQVRGIATELRDSHGHEAQTLVRPKTWEDMYQSFDAVDLWFKGSWNLWRVLHLLCDENDGLMTTSDSEMDPEMDSDMDQAARDEIEGWAYNWCTHETNRFTLSTWDQTSDILRLLSPADSQDIHGCNSQVLNVLRAALEYWHDKYKESPHPQEDGKGGDFDRSSDMPEVSLTTTTQDGRQQSAFHALPLLSPHLTDHRFLDLVD